MIAKWKGWDLFGEPVRALVSSEGEIKMVKKIKNHGNLVSIIFSPTFIILLCCFYCSFFSFIIVILRIAIIQMTSHTFSAVRWVSSTPSPSPDPVCYDWCQIIPGSRWQWFSDTKFVKDHNVLQRTPKVRWDFISIQGKLKAG